MEILHGCAGRLTAENGGFLPGQGVPDPEYKCGAENYVAIDNLDAKAR